MQQNCPDDRPQYLIDKCYVNCPDHQRRSPRTRKCRQKINSRAREVNLGRRITCKKDFEPLPPFGYCYKKCIPNVQLRHPISLRCRKIANVPVMMPGPPAVALHPEPPPPPGPLPAAVPSPGATPPAASPQNESPAQQQQQQQQQHQDFNEADDYLLYNPHAINPPQQQAFTPSPTSPHNWEERDTNDNFGSLSRDQLEALENFGARMTPPPSPSRNLARVPQPPTRSSPNPTRPSLQELERQRRLQEMAEYDARRANRTSIFQANRNRQTSQGEGRQQLSRSRGNTNKRKRTKKSKGQRRMKHTRIHYH
jgi:hypothetical protein